MSLALVVGAYLLGSIPFGVLLARTAGVDVRRAGSGNIGATNVARTAGARLGVATLLADVAKGALPVVVARLASGEPAVVAAAGVAALLGHVFPPALRFAGGKGVATGLGALLVLAPAGAAVTVVLFGLALAAFGYVSLASVVAAVGMPVALVVLGASRPTLIAAVVMAVVIVARHAENLRRLRAGTEPKARLLKKQASPAE